MKQTILIIILFFHFLLMTATQAAGSNIDKMPKAKRVGKGIEILMTGIAESPEGVSVYRVHDKTFEFGKHYRNYFDSMTCSNKDLYSGGTFVRTPERALVYRDESVTLGSTYVYWMETTDGKRHGPLPIKMRDPEVWWPYDKVARRLDEIAKMYPETVELKSFGKSAEGREITGLIAGNRKNLIAVVGLIHAGESGPELMIPALERLLAEDGDLLRQVGLAILPSANPDERERNVFGVPYYLRKNSRGVDINRNFPADWETVHHAYNVATDNPNSGTYRGPAPQSESETRAVMRFVEEFRPAALFSYHSLASICGACFLGSSVANKDKDYAEACRRFARAYTDGMYPGETRKLLMPFTTAPGSLPTWLYRTFKIPAFDLEHDGNPDSKPALKDKTSSEMLRLYQDRHYAGLKRVLQMLAKEIQH